MCVGVGMVRTMQVDSLVQVNNFSRVPAVKNITSCQIMSNVEICAETWAINWVYMPQPSGTGGQNVIT